MNTKINITMLSIIAVFMIIVFSACSKMDETYKGFIDEGEIYYVKKPDSIGIQPGNERAKVWFVSSAAKDLSRGVVYWNNRTDSIEIPIATDLRTDTISAVIENIPEGSYTFEFVTFDKEGNYSLPVDSIGEVYGENYQAALNTRIYRDLGVVGASFRIFWYESNNTDALGSEIRYTDLTGKEITVFVKPNEDYTRINELPFEHSIEIRSVFKPHPLSIDTFYTDYKIVHLEPMDPIELDKSKFLEHKLPTDADRSIQYSDGMFLLWDGDPSSSSYWRTNNGSGTPHWFTFDLGVTAELRQLVIWQRSITESNLMFNNANIRLFEVWGSNDPDPDGSWESWTKLMDCESKKPSGLKRGQLSDADRRQVEDGEIFIFPDNTPQVKFLRIKVNETWNPGLSDRSFISELSVLGFPE